MCEHSARKCHNVITRITNYVQITTNVKHFADKCKPKIMATESPQIWRKTDKNSRRDKQIHGKGAHCAGPLGFIGLIYM